ncbi:MAG TPA: T9SS type A sorting domain-containing protein [Bacteroidia bacterium]|nr:T9SS type A sorting domain-containing protein [Bacteroidia bacterium]
MLKKFKLILVVMLFWQVNTISAQGVVSGEYFWDSDPGQGNGTVVTAVDGSFGSAIEQILSTVSSLPSVGSHIFNVRVKDSDGHWGSLFRTTVQVLPSITTSRPIKVKAAESFWDIDPGQGNGTVLLAFDGNYNDAIESFVNTTLPIPSSQAIHTLNIRVKDAANIWSPVYRVNVDVQASIASTRPIKVTSGEYFWDTDPGNGNGTTLLAFDGNYNDATEQIYKNISTSGLSVSLHTLNIRVKDAANVWGPTFKTIVDVQALITSVRPIKIVSAEYYFDTDPGNGNATPMIAFDGNFNAAMEVIAGNNIPQPVLQGVHTLYMRAKDYAGGWGPSFGVVVNVDTSINSFATSINGTASFCSPVSNPQTYSTPASSGNTYSWSLIGGSIISGQGTNSIQVNWTGTGFHSITVIECNSTQSLCDTAQLTVNVYTAQTVSQTQNICQGDSINIAGTWVSSAGTYSHVYTSSNGCDSTVNVTVGVYPSYSISNNASIVSGDSLFVGGAWQKSPGTYTDHFNTIHGCDSTIVTHLTVTFTSVINGSTSICQSAASNISYTAVLHPGSSYNWQVSGGNIVGSSGINNVSVTWTSSGTNTISVIECNSNLSFCDTAILNVIVSSGVINNLIQSICTGDSIYVGGDWQTSSGSYNDTIVTGTGCDTINITNLTVYPNYADTNQIVISQGDSVFLAGSWQTATGVYVDHFNTSHGCDSTITTYLLVIVGIEENTLSSIQIVPNPAKNQIRINGISNIENNFSLYDLSGKLILKKEQISDHDIIDLSSISNGMYLIQFRQSDKVRFMKLEVIK